jgi:biopolymer transport protein ExbD
MITRPFDLQSHLKQPSRRFEVLPLLDIFFIVLFFSLLASKFVLSPGLAIDLPKGENPRMPGVSASAVLTVRSSDMLLFRDRILSLDTLQLALVEEVAERGETNLLINFDREVSVQTLFSVAEIAREAGVGRVQLAFEPRGEEVASGATFP